MPDDPTDEIFAELERRKGSSDDVYSEPDPGLGAAAPDRISETLQAAEEREAEQRQFAADVAARGYGDAVKRRLRRQS